MRRIWAIYPWLLSQGFECWKFGRSGSLHQYNHSGAVCISMKDPNSQMVCIFVKLLITLSIFLLSSWFSNKKILGQSPFNCAGVSACNTSQERSSASTSETWPSWKLIYILITCHFRQDSQLRQTCSSAMHRQIYPDGSRQWTLRFAFHSSSKILRTPSTTNYALLERFAFLSEKRKTNWNIKYFHNNANYAMVTQFALEKRQIERRRIERRQIET